MYADKHGSSRVLAFGAVVAALGFALRGVFDDPTLFILTGFIVGVGTGACSFPVVIVALGKVVQPAQRSFIMGLGGLSGHVCGRPHCHNADWIDGLGRVDLFHGVFICADPALLIFVARVSETPTGAGMENNTWGAVKVAFSDRSYTLLFFGFFVRGFHVQFIQTHLPAYIIDEGLTPIIGA